MNGAERHLIDSAIFKLLAGFGSYVLFDVPVHNNVGDSAIFLGELAYLRWRFPSRPVHSFRGDQFGAGRSVERYRDALILIHGGGNFGDLWPWHHDRRESLLESFRGRKIVQLAQTIMFNSAEALDRTRRVVARHGNFTLFVRDRRSYDFAVGHFDCEVALCPDMAYCLEPPHGRLSVSKEALLLMRTDHERMPHVAPGSAFSYRMRDWPQDGRITRGLKTAKTTLVNTYRHAFELGDRDLLRNDFFERLAADRVDLGIALLRTGRYVVTDRLHAYILSDILGLPCAAIDNNYGKVSGYISTWNTKQGAKPTYDTIAEAMVSMEAIASVPQR